MDKTSVWNDIVSSTTLDKTGSKDVPLKTTGHEKVRVSICLATKGDGTKLKSFVVFAGQNVNQNVCMKNISVSVLLHQVQMVG